MNFDRLKLLVLDVDGVLTDGRLFPLTNTAAGARVELTGKAFHVQDGHAIKMWHSAGGTTAIITGRKSPVVQARASELNVRWLVAGVEDKSAAFEEILAEAECVADQAICIGDDLPDVPLLQQCGLPIAVANALPAVKKHAHYVTRRSGGQGAIAEIVEFILRKQQRWAGGGGSPPQPALHELSHSA